jgi:hypothetical protein
VDNQRPRAVRRTPPTHRVQLTRRDVEVLAFAAEHRFVMADHLSSLLGITPAAADTRVAALARAGFVTREHVFHQQPPCHRITARGLSVTGSALQPPRRDLRCYEHDVGVAWLWLAARDGRFGPTRAVLGERRLRSEDARREPGEQPLAVRLGGFGAAGVERLHYPDLLLVDPEGRRIALELELTAKGRRRLEGILGGYGADDRIDAVVYLVKDRRLGRSIAQSARKIGISSQVFVKGVTMSGVTEAEASAAGLGRGRRIGGDEVSPIGPGRGRATGGDGVSTIGSER